MTVIRIRLGSAIGVLWLVAAIGPSLADEPVRVFAAGSLGPAFREMARDYQTATGQSLALTFAPAGTLLERIEKGEAADLFASANMEHPQRLAGEGKASPAVLFVRNSLCGITRRDVGLTQANFLDRMLDPAVTLATSTPISDPSGDYAWAMFGKADQLHPGAKEHLEGKARQFMGTAKSPAAAPPGTNPILWALQEKKADIFLTYCSAGTGMPADIVAVSPPPTLAVGADFGLTILNGDAARELAAYRFALYILSPDGQALLRRFGFETSTDR
jgi:molybdate transport system substrate-binding protein